MVEHVGSIEARLRAMTPEQRHARLMELQAKVDAVTAWNRQHASKDEPIEDANADGQQVRSSDGAERAQHAPCVPPDEGGTPALMSTGRSSNRLM